MDKIIVLILFIFSKVSSRNLTKLYEDARLIDEAIAKNTKHHYIHPRYDDDEDNIRIIHDTGDDVGNPGGEDVGNPGGDDDDIPFFRDYPHDDPKTKYEVEAIVGNKTVQLCDAMVQDPYFNQELDDSPIYKTYAKPWANHTGMILNSIIEIFGNETLFKNRFRLNNFFKFFNNNKSIDYKGMRGDLDPKIKDLMIKEFQDPSYKSEIYDEFINKTNTTEPVKNSTLPEQKTVNRKAEINFDRFKMAFARNKRLKKDFTSKPNGTWKDIRYGYSVGKRMRQTPRISNITAKNILTTAKEPNITIMSNKSGIAVATTKNINIETVIGKKSNIASTTTLEKLNLIPKSGSTPHLEDSTGKQIVQTPKQPNISTIMPKKPDMVTKMTDNIVTQTSIKSNAITNKLNRVIQSDKQLNVIPSQTNNSNDATQLIRQPYVIEPQANKPNDATQLIRQPNGVIKLRKNSLREQNLSPQKEVSEAVDASSVYKEKFGSLVAEEQNVVSTIKPDKKQPIVDTPNTTSLSYSDPKTPEIFLMKSIGRQNMTYEPTKYVLATDHVSKTDQSTNLNVEKPGNSKLESTEKSMTSNSNDYLMSQLNSIKQSINNILQYLSDINPEYNITNDVI